MWASNRVGQLLLIAAIVIVPNSVFALTTGTALPLDQYQAGSESTTLVPNGNFETGTEWTATAGDTARAAPFDPPSPASTVGDFAFHALVGDPNSTTDQFTHDDTFTFNTNENYVLSAYMWNSGSFFFDGTNLLYDLAEVKLSDGTNSALISFGASPFPSGWNFVYVSFSGSLFTSAATLTASGIEAVGPEGSPYVQIDNIAITPESQFAPPTLIPEPASVGAVMLGALSLLRRRAARA